jgi:cob(I)alamin adenosyltransferase
MHMKIYTKTGDKGQTSLFDGTRVLKSHTRVETYGTIDELNSFIGLCVSCLTNIKNQDTRIKQIVEELQQIQHDLFAIGSALAMPHPLPIVGLDTRPGDFEKLIDQLTGELPELKNFILPGGSIAAAYVHVCRSISRRAERHVVTLVQKDDIEASILIYLNRLSDLFFTFARYINYHEKQKEIIWIKK